MAIDKTTLPRLFLEVAEIREERIHDALDRKRMLYALRVLLDD